MNIIFWQNVPSPHQVSLVKSLAQNKQVSVTVVAQEHLPDWRIDSGWAEPDFGYASVVTNPDDDTITSLLNDVGGNKTHIFSGLRAYSLPWRAFQSGIQMHATIGVYSEAEKWHGLKGSIRLLRGKLDARRYGKHIDFILAIGHLGLEWFYKCGYRRQIIYPFGYFVEPPTPGNSAQLANTSTNANFQIVFIGQCIYRKGVDILLRALDGLKHFPWKLTIIGDGDKRVELQQLSRELGLEERVQYTGALPNDLAMQRLAESDLFVLPSQWDGWGAVINESLMRGVPVVCSANCGAADLLKNDGHGTVFLTGSVDDLCDKLRQQMLLGKLTQLRRESIRKWATENISGETAAIYLLEIIKHSGEQSRPRPAAPWLREQA